MIHPETKNLLSINGVGQGQGQGEFQKYEIEEKAKPSWEKSRLEFEVLNTIIIISSLLIVLLLYYFITEIKYDIGHKQEGSKGM